MKTIKLFFLFTILATFFPTTSFAFGTVSRVCRFNDIPYGTKYAAAKFFVFVGAPPSTINLWNQPDSVTQDYIIREALTTDIRAQYYLFARATIYTIDGYASTSSTVFLRYSGYYESPWGATQVADAVKADPTLSPYYFNRGPLFSVRAGNPQIVEYIPKTNVLDYVVIGEHWIWDGNSKFLAQLPNSRANTCNLKTLGYGLFDW